MYTLFCSEYIGWAFSTWLLVHQLRPSYTTQFLLSIIIPAMTYLMNTWLMLASLPSVTCTSLPRCHELLTRCFLCLLMLINNWTPVKISSFSDLGYWNPLVFSGSPNFVNFGLFFWTVFFLSFQATSAQPHLHTRQSNLPGLGMRSVEPLLQGPAMGRENSQRWHPSTLTSTLARPEGVLSGWPQELCSRIWWVSSSHLIWALWQYAPIPEKVCSIELLIGKNILKPL